ncbi:hypothetical protein GPS47_14145 [Acinetobacter haemolyticus]|uniref:hypothetical protein n=1 Tax=Acinetobacter haemolyticus TaxID=29430 RepID=UPI000E596930|nr:hypothetical protein [Acinetobacter haemolyticus]NAS06695.1 hypothetical protein [Acinetobacter haemolyticus]QDJ92711.1 hypothetical protein AhaeAN54_011820 [Acinetobacter haemolyticus]
MKNFGVALIFGTALFLTVKFLWHWYKVGLNHDAIIEWFGRGFFFALGILTATLTVILVMRLVIGDKA